MKKINFSLINSLKLLFILIFIWIFISFYGCAPIYIEQAGNINKPLNQFMAAGNCQEALKLANNMSEKYGRKAHLLYLLDSAIINMQCGDYETAKNNFKDAEELAQYLWTQSVTQEASSLVINEYTKPYRGEDFERALINLFAGFTYIMTGEYDEAMVECRKLDIKLSEYNKKYEKKNVYKEDALGRYISGILSEITDKKNYSEAYLYYKEAYEAYQTYLNDYKTPIPLFVIQDLIRVAKAADREDELPFLLPNYEKINYIEQKKADNLGKIIFINFNGKCPRKVEKSFFINVPKFSSDQPGGMVKIAFPKYIANDPACSDSKIILTPINHTNDTNIFEAQAILGEDINNIAIKSLADREKRINFKTVARVMLKQTLAQTAGSAAGEKLGKKMGGDDGALIGIIIGRAIAREMANVTERADIRSWRALPAEIYISRLFVEPGDYNVSVERCKGSLDQLNSINIKAGETKFIFYDTIYSTTALKKYYQK
jgi:uncharacterized protein